MTTAQQPAHPANLDSLFRHDEQGHLKSEWLRPNIDFIADPVFNKGRTVDPKDSKGNTHTLRGSVGPNAMMSKVVKAIVLRHATQDERARWHEIHGTDAWFAALDESTRNQYIPHYIVADGFGRVDAHLEANKGNPEARMECKIFDSDNQDKAKLAAVYFNSTSRGSHYLDQYDAYKIAKAQGYKQKEIAAMFGVSEPQVSGILKVCSKVDDALRKKIIKKDIPFYKLEKIVLGDRKGGGEGEDSEDGEKVKPISAGKRKHYVDALKRAAGTFSNNATLSCEINAMEFALRFAAGEFGGMTFHQAALSCHLLENAQGFDFEAVPEGAAPAKGGRKKKAANAAAPAAPSAPPPPPPPAAPVTAVPPPPPPAASAPAASAPAASAAPAATGKKKASSNKGGSATTGKKASAATGKKKAVKKASSKK